MQNNMKNKGESLVRTYKGRSFGSLRRVGLVCALVVGITGFALVSPSAARSNSAKDIPAQPSTASSDPYSTTVDYVTQFYPLWFTYYQAKVDGLVGTTNMMVAPKQVSPIYHFVVAINADTLYSSVYFDLTTEPVVVTIPPNPDNVPFSTLVLDPYGNEIMPKSRPRRPASMPLPDPIFTARFPEGSPACRCRSTTRACSCGRSN
jgi:hypothetical protein